MQIKSIAVFCGSKMGNNELFKTHTETLGNFLAQKNIELIYGGGNKGLMGTIANTVLQHGGSVVGIIPTILSEREHQHKNLTQLIVVNDMHTRKKMMYDKCDAAIILPGGFGTLDEFFELLTWNQLNIHTKKIFILNTDGFYDHLIMHINKMYSEGFLYDTIESRITILNNPTELEKHFALL